MMWTKLAYRLIWIKKILYRFFKNEKLSFSTKTIIFHLGLFFNLLIFIGSSIFLYIIVSKSDKKFLRSNVFKIIKRKSFILNLAQSAIALIIFKTLANIIFNFPNSIVGFIFFMSLLIFCIFMYIILSQSYNDAVVWVSELKKTLSKLYIDILLPRLVRTTRVILVIRNHYKKKSY